MYESGAMIRNILDRHGDGALQPTPGSAEAALTLQWSWFAEATFARPLGDRMQHIVLKPEAERIEAVVEDGRLDPGDGQKCEVLTQARASNAWRYLASLEERPAYQRANSYA